MITVQEFARAVPCNPAIAAIWHPHVIKAAEKWKINTKSRLAGFIAQMSHESGGFTKFSESLNYSVDSLAATWPSRYAVDPKASKKVPNALALRIGRTATQPADQKMIANLTYGNRFGNISGTDDGWNYRGRGPKQITFKDNYRSCGKAIGLDLVGYPDMLMIPAHGAMAAAWYWGSHGCNEMMDSNNFKGVTLAINGGLIGHEDGNTTGVDDRVERYACARNAIGA